ncbi:four helix bundle protein [Pelovirga terrestris]|uniref:Four helix bundle protein n=1 Tax=Pelovirga terrestris TaxID=2771352 RepID=A0A8J6UKK1_9BACT|nr:four helix bundle protein [Pelovirga terrestris]MBD1399542.1 four helix bundle protein [Pelovirga terrestris]
MEKGHEKLEAWKLSMRLVKAIYDMTAHFPIEERFGLSQQMRRAAISIPSNIAEGAARYGSKEYAHFISIARGSLAELDTQVKIAVMLGFLPSENSVGELSDRVGRLLTGLHRKWKNP